MLDSTIWTDRDAREVFITALLMAKPRTLEEPLAQIEVRTLRKSGFRVPAGEYGFVEAAGSGIVRRSGVDTEAGLAALERLGAPELDSRTPDWEGRRLVRVDGGFVVLNYMQYRAKDYTAADRMRRFRERERLRKPSRTKAQIRAEARGREARFVAAEGNQAEQDRIAAEGLASGNT